MMKQIHDHINDHLRLLPTLKITTISDKVKVYDDDSDDVPKLGLKFYSCCYTEGSLVNKCYIQLRMSDMKTARPRMPSPFTAGILAALSCSAIHTNHH